MGLMSVDLQAPADVEAEELKPIVRGIVHSENKPFAVIGTELMQEGEEVLGATIVKINPDSVEFEMAGERWTQMVEGQEN
jgi:type II secretory pathway component PulC